MTTDIEANPDAPSPLTRPSLLGKLFFRVGSLTFGGGYASIATLHKELVTNRHWLTQSQFDLCYALARLTPGTNLLAFCVATGWTMFGIIGALTAVASLSIPSSIFVVLVSFIYTVGSHYSFVQTALQGILASTIGILVATVWILVRPSLTSGRWGRASAIFVTAFLLNFVFSLSPIKVLGLASIIGLVWQEGKKK